MPTLSLKQSLLATGLELPFSFREDFETYPRSLREVIRVLGLPKLHLSWDDHDELWEKTDADAQGIACIDGSRSVITVAKKIFLTDSAGEERYGNIIQTASVAHFVDQTDVGIPCDHFSDADHRDGLIFFVFEADNDETPSALFGCTTDFQVVGYTKVGPEASNSCCALHPWNGLLYFKGSAPGFTHTLVAFDVSAYFERFAAGTDDWGTEIAIERREGWDVHLKNGAGQPTSVEGIQGIAFSPNGRVYLPHWHAYENLLGTFWENYFSVFDALTGRRMWYSGEIDFEGDGDEIEGVSLFPPEGEVFFVQTDNDLETDELYLHRFKLAAELVADGGGDPRLVI